MVIIYLFKKIELFNYLSLYLIYRRFRINAPTNKIESLSTSCNGNSIISILEPYEYLMLLRTYDIFL